MPLIDGIGDEVMQFGIAVILVIVAILAWLSTNARPDRYRAVIQMHARSHNAVTVSIRTNPRPPTSSNTSSQIENRLIPLQEMDSIVDADMAMMDNNRLHFYRRVTPPATVQSADETESASEASDVAEEPEPEPPSAAQMREMDSIVSAMEADLADPPVADNAAALNDASSIPQNDATADTSLKEEVKNTASNVGPVGAEASTANTTDPEPSDHKKIVIKLKYINDTLKEVEGRLDEPLKDFKCRHFSAELGAARRVRLIFNGRALLDEAATLRACGLHHRAVVHCLVQPPRAHAHRTGTHAQPQSAERAPATDAASPERFWDLENILMTLVSLALTIVWFFRCEYSNLFTASASVALFGLTAFYSVAIFAIYLSDTFHFERRPPAPAPAPAPHASP